MNKIYRNSVLNFVIGVNLIGEPVFFDLKTNQHLLIAGTTGSGKDTFLCSYLYLLMKNNTPESLRLILVDNTRVVLTPFNNTKYLFAPMITDMDLVPKVLEWLLGEIETRFNALVENKVRNIDEYNEKSGKVIYPRIVVMVRELTELMIRHPAGIEMSIVKITQLTKAVGIHLILCTQRPHPDIVTGLIKANISARMAFHTTTAEESKIILDQSGAEQLGGKGDMLLLTHDQSIPTRLTSEYVKENVIDDYVKTIKGEDYDKDLIRLLDKTCNQM